jgi:hypothetical protein
LFTGRIERLLWGFALLAGVAPLWAARHLPLVDLPQHLHLISVLHRLNDPTTLYPEIFSARGELTPYLGYYHLVSLLNWLLPLDLANKVFLSAYVVGMPLGLAFLLRSLNRPTWPALLALPFAYGDSLAWGFINYCSALPLTFLCCGLFVRGIADVPRQKLWSGLLALTLVGVLLFHVQAFAFLGLGLPWLLITTRVPEDATFRAWLRNRRWVLAGVSPGVALFLIWMGGRLGQPAEIQQGVPWKAWGPMLSPQNLEFKSFEQNRAELVSVLGNMLRDGSDRWAVQAVGVVALLAVFAGLFSLDPRKLRPHWSELRSLPWFQRRSLSRTLLILRMLLRLLQRMRLPGLAAIALAMFFLLPFDIRGYMYYLNTRFAHLAAPLVLACVPVLQPSLQRVFQVLALACAVVLAVPLSKGFAAFDREMEPLEQLANATAPKPRVMGLIYNYGSRVMTHPVFLHAST